MIIRFIGATSPNSKFAGCVFVVVSSVVRNFPVMNGSVRGTFGGRSCPRTHLLPLLDEHKRDGCGTPGPRLRSVHRNSSPSGNPEHRTSKLVRASFETFNKTLTFRVRASGSTHTEAATTSNRFRVRVCNGIVPKSAYNQCSRGFSASW